MSKRMEILARMDFPGFSGQIRDYHWSAGESISLQQDNFVIAYRSYPVNLDIVARHNDVTNQRFGQLTFLPEKHDVQILPATKHQRARSISCQFNWEWICRVCGGMMPLSDSDLNPCFDVQNIHLENILQRIGSELTHPRPATSLYIEALSVELGIEIARYFREPIRPFRVRTHEGKLRYSDFVRIVEYVESVENRIPSVKEISDICGISSAHLRRAFKNTTGGTIHEFVANSRIKKAQALLRDTDLQLKEISFRIGFGSPTTFSAAFKQLTGEAPSEYRLRARRG